VTTATSKPAAGRESAMETEKDKWLRVYRKLVSIRKKKVN